MRKLIAAIALMALSSCGGGAFSTGRPVGGTDLSLSYRLILYQSYEEETHLYMAVLDREDDAFTLTPFAVENTFSVAEGLSSDEALSRAEAHMRRPGGYDGMLLREIKGKDGAFLGYEAIPMYEPMGTARAESPVVNYFSSRKEPGVVSFIVRPPPSSRRGPLLLDQKRLK